MWLVCFLLGFSLQGSAVFPLEELGGDSQKQQKKAKLGMCGLN